MRIISKITLILCVCTMVSACTQTKKSVKYSSEVQELVDQIAADNYVGTPVVGKGGGPSEAYQRREKLMVTASIKELRDLVYQKNAAVSLTAFQGLCDNKDDSVPYVLESIYAKENISVHVIRGDISLEMSTLEYAYGYILGLPLPGSKFQHDALVDYAITTELQNKLKARIAEFNSSNPIE